MTTPKPRNSKEIILHKSLELFSVNGFEAVSTRMIAREAGMSDTAIYKHFKSKQEIFDTIIAISKERFITQRNKVDIKNMNWDDVEKICLDMFRFQTEDEWIVMFRKILLIEQFKNPEMAKLYRYFFIDIPLDSTEQIFKWLINEGYVVKKNPRVIAMELYAPFFMYHTLNPKSETIVDELKQHIEFFRENVRVKQ